MAYSVEYTDTFGGEANYCWVRRGTIADPAQPYRSRAYRRALLRAARAAVNLAGVKGDVVADFGDEVHWVPRGCCTILMVRYDDSPATSDDEWEG